MPRDLSYKVCSREISKERVLRLERLIEELLPAWSLAPAVTALQALRGVNLIVAVTFVAEIGDLKRFESPRHLMPISAWYRASAPPATPSGAVVSPKPAMAGSGICCRECLDLPPSAADRGHVAPSVLWATCGPSVRASGPRMANVTPLDPDDQVTSD
jgi:hypothetical protein